MNKNQITSYETDASRLKGNVEKVIFPQTIEEIQQVIKTTNLDIVPRGAGTGLVGGTIPNNSIIIDMSKMNKVTNFDLKQQTVKVEAGTTLKELNEKLNKVGFEFPIKTLNNQISTIGGMIATNAAGEHTLKYNTIREWIQEVEFINGRGEIVKPSKVDIADTCGMEGTTGCHHNQSS